MSEPVEKIKDQAATILAGMMMSPVICMAFTRNPGGLVNPGGPARQDVDMNSMVKASVDITIMLRETVEDKCSTK